MKNLTLFAIAASALPFASANSNRSSKYWFSFGDSYTTTGFNVTGVQPSPSNPFGNPAYPGVNTCGTDSPTWINYVATKFNSSLVQVYNHAYSGATVDAAIVSYGIPEIRSLKQQTDDFLAFDAPGKQYYPGWKSSNSLFSFWIGINDINISYTRNGSYTEFDKVLLNRYFELVQSIYNVGARDFLFLTIPPVERTPFMLTTPVANRTLEHEVIADYNQQLLRKVSSFAASHRDVTVKVYDTRPIFNAVLDHPSNYGIVDAVSYGNGSDVAWCNEYHPSSAFHFQIAKEVAKLIKKYI
ncbi:carbohydrate esterase family 16 protein [Serendipita vermifera MAFF 305830]|uniref:Carbohydrate esterase family 16 protein n=1 Tax=Serendipita vermifera MAFF 305830 TaxID=933852 RepID=A0A0C3BNV8_SERVB|nr:carbohydrate esterase family 16 protein [Serendipita vermifera MAFF 305830]KIM33705.1 carbohydrate esterase family 16 protein [Serendipita vermifera MAFF 305830]